MMAAEPGFGTAEVDFFLGADPWSGFIPSLIW
jgi:hypothetical protein